MAAEELDFGSVSLERLPPGGNDQYSTPLEPDDFPGFLKRWEFNPYRL